MASFGKVLDLLDDRYLELQDVVGNVEPLPTLVPYEKYIQNVLVYRMDTNHEIFIGLVQDFMMRQAYEMGKELWTWFVQWEIDSLPAQQPSSPKKVRLDAHQASTLSKAPLTPRPAPALTIFERRTLDGALMLEEDMLRILIDIVQVASSLVPNFIEFLYRWIDYYEGDGKALKAALRWEIPSLWDFEYHPLVLPQDEGNGNDEEGEDATNEQGEGGARSVNNNKAAELRQSSPTKKMGARPKPDLAAIEIRTFYTEVSERLQYREVKFGIQPPKLEQPLSPLINIPRDQHKRTKYYAACFKSRQRALYLLLEAGVTMRQINNYHKLQTAHPKETPETGDNNGLRNYHKDAKYAQAQFELKEKQIKQREITISNKLAVEAQLAASHAVPDGAAGLPLIPPTPSYARKPDMAAAMMQRIQDIKAKKDEKINIVPGPLVGRMKSKLFENARKKPELELLRDFTAEAGWYTERLLTVDRTPPRRAEDSMRLADTDNQIRCDARDDDEGMDLEDGFSSDSDGDGGDADVTPAPVSAPSLPRPTLPQPPLPQFSTPTLNAAHTLNVSNFSTHQHRAGVGSSSTPGFGRYDQETPTNIATYMQSLNTEQAQCLLPLLNPHARQAATDRLQASSRVQSTAPQTLTSSIVGPVNLSTSAQPAYMTDAHIISTLPQASQVQQSPESLSPLSRGLATAMGIEQSQLALPGPSFVASPLVLPKQRAQSSLPDRPQSPYISSSSAVNPLNSLPTATGFASTFVRRASPVSTGFNPDYFMYLLRQQEASRPADTPNTPVMSPQPVQPGNQLVSQPQLMPASDLRQQSPAQFQRMLSAGPASGNAQERTFQDEAAQPESQHDQQSQTLQPADRRFRVPVVPSPSASLLLTPQPQSQSQTWPPFLEPVSSLQATSQTSSNCFTTIPPYPPSLGAMLPPPRPGITRNAPTPLFLSPSNPSALTTFAPQVLATSPFLDLSSNTETPIQIYFPKILIPGNGIGPPGTKTGNSSFIETDALMLGYEDTKSGRLVLSKAILLPVGVWGETLRKVRSGRWSVMETYACPSSHPAKGKGKGKLGDEVVQGCHRAAYDKLAQAYGMMNAAPAVREDELTKRWRVSRGPMTSHDRGAVWEGWGAYVDKGIEMSASERRDASKSEAKAADKIDVGGLGDGYSRYSGDTDEAERRKKEMEELMDEDEEMDD